MKAEWSIDKGILQNIQKVIDDNIEKPFVQERKKKNVEKKGIELSKNIIWKALVGCEITTQQKSGNDSFVYEFLKSISFVLSYDDCKESTVQSIADELSRNYLRNNVRVASFLKEITDNLENGGWEELIKNLEFLRNEHTVQDEIHVASFCSNSYKGIGLKQSRNFLQWLGLTEYEIPIDSRVLKMLKKCQVNFVPGASALQDEATYLYLEKGIQSVCEELKIKPCVLDACFFANFEKDINKGDRQ